MGPRLAPKDIIVVGGGHFPGSPPEGLFLWGPALAGRAGLGPSLSRELTLQALPLGALPLLLQGVCGESSTQGGPGQVTGGLFSA